VCGVVIGKPRVLLHVQRLTGMRRDPDTGALARVWGGVGSGAAATLVPELALLRHPAPDPRFAPHGPLPLAARFPVGAPVVVLRGPARGALAAVSGHAGGVVQVELADAPGDAAEPPFGHSIAASVKDAYYDAKRAADVLGLPPGILGKVTGSVIVQPGRFDLGLNLKVSRVFFLPGYVRAAAAGAGGAQSSWAAGAGAGGAHTSPAAHGSGGFGAAWEYTERAIHLVAAYQRAFPLVFALLAAAPDAPTYELRAIPGGAETVERVGTWLQQLDTYKKPLVPTSSAFLAPAAMAAVQRAADALAAARRAKRAAAAAAAAAPAFISVPPADLFAREAHAYAVGGVGAGAGAKAGAADAAAVSAGGPPPSPAAAAAAAAAAASAMANVDGPACLPRLGDRVVNLSFRQAPLGGRATVVAVHAASGHVELIFDEEFLGGSTLAGACGKGRGALAPWSALLCASRAPDAAAAAAAAGADAAADAADARAGGLADDGMPRGKKRLEPARAAAAAAAGAGAGTSPRVQAPAAADVPRKACGGGGGGGGGGGVAGDDCRRAAGRWQQVGARRRFRCHRRRQPARRRPHGTARGRAGGGAGAAAAAAAASSDCGAESVCASVCAGGGGA
jgi:5'-3' exoribonuclease 1